MEVQIPLGTFTSTLVALFEKGVRYSTIVDIGCADGNFYLDHYSLGVFPDSTVLNIDANPIYEHSLKAIKEVMGGHYFIGAMTDHADEVEMTTAAHPYWNSMRPEGDLYWERINHLHADKVKVPAVTLDSLVDKFRVEPPFLVKLDIQGTEVQALRGARNVLRETEAVICEADLEDFQAINEVLVASGFGLFDVTALHRLADRTLGWFYPVFLNRRLDSIKRRAFWDEPQNTQIIKLQVDRRNAILEQNARLLAQYRALRKSDI
jgi:FkbM family methyltransferase